MRGPDLPGCLAEIREAHANQRQYSEQLNLAILGEIDWAEEYLAAPDAVPTARRSPLAQEPRKGPEQVSLTTDPKNKAGNVARAE